MSKVKTKEAFYKNYYYESQSIRYTIISSILSINFFKFY